MLYTVSLCVHKEIFLMYGIIDEKDEKVWELHVLQLLVKISFSHYHLYFLKKETQKQRLEFIL